eukprot:8804334-Pyramimonas_sp.AAC.1
MAFTSAPPSTCSMFFFGVLLGLGERFASEAVGPVAVVGVATAALGHLGGLGQELAVGKLENL